MAKKIIALLLALTLVFALASCSGKSGQSEKVVPSEKKVAILVCPETQAPEDIRAAKALAEKYPDKVIVKECDDSRVLTPGDTAAIKFSRELAADETVGAIIYSKATYYVNDAIREAKKINENLRFICIEPEFSIDTACEKADVVLCADWAKAAEDIVAQAKKQGAEYFLMFSMERHISKNPLYAAEREFIEKACEAQGVNFLYDHAKDSFYAGGINTAQRYVKESVARQFLNNKVKGNGVALFSTDSCVQTTLIECANKRGLIYVSPSFPTPYNGVNEIYAAELPADIESCDDFVKAVTEAAKADAEGTAKLSMYTYPLTSKILTGALYIAFDMLNGTTTAENLAERVQLRVGDTEKDEKLTVEAYHDTELKNAFAVYYPAYEVIK